MTSRGRKGEAGEVRNGATRHSSLARIVDRESRALARPKYAT